MRRKQNIYFKSTFFINIYILILFCDIMNETTLLLPPIQSLQHFDPLRFGLEFAYSLLVAALFLFIFYKTKNFFKITKHEGINYFNLAFLFFALAFFSRFLFYVVRLVVLNSSLHIPGRTLSFFSLVLVTYFSTIAIGYLIFSTQYKKFKHSHFLILINLLAALSIAIFYFNHSIIYFLAIQLLLMATLLFVNAKKSIRFVYPLMSLFWIMNIVIFHTRRFLGFEIKLVLQILSLGLLIYFIYKVLKWTK